MPEIYLSPSTQEYNPYIDGGNEEYYMNLIGQTQGNTTFIWRYIPMQLPGKIQERYGAHRFTILRDRRREKRLLIFLQKISELYILPRSLYG